MSGCFGFFQKPVEKNDVINNSESLLSSNPTGDVVFYNIANENGQIVQKKWLNSKNNLRIKVVECFYEKKKLIKEVVKIYKNDGVTLSAQITTKYNYDSSNALIGSVAIRDI